MSNTKRRQRLILIQAVAFLLLGLGGSVLRTTEAATLTFDDISDLSDYAPLGITFSANVTLWTTSAPSVLDDPFGGPVTTPSGICADGCAAATGSVFFEVPVTEISIYALSGPGADTLSDNVRIDAYNGGGALVATAMANSALQFELLSVTGASIKRLDLVTSGERLDAWDNLTFQPVPVPPAAWLFGSGLLGLIGLARKRKAV